MSNCKFVTFPLVSLVRCGTWLYRFLIFAPLLTSCVPCADALHNFGSFVESQISHHICGVKFVLKFHIVIAFNVWRTSTVFLRCKELIPNFHKCEESAPIPHTCKESVPNPHICEKLVSNHHLLKIGIKTLTCGELVPNPHTCEILVPNYQRY